MTAITSNRSLALSLAVALGASGCASFRDQLPRKVESTAPGPIAAHQMAELWVDPGDMAARDLLNGPGGADMAPPEGATFRFVEKDTKGFSSGWDVDDAAGVRWSVKHGLEARSEIVASRLLWALGYHQAPMYYVERWSIADGPEPGPKEPGRFRRLLPGERRTGEWSWHQNPFVDTREYKGLLVMMRILNNWDLLERNTTFFEAAPGTPGPARKYVVIDLGASLGRTKILPHSGTRNDVEDFEQQGYIKKVDGVEVVFDDLGRRHRELFGNLTLDDVRWVSERLARLTDAQWRDAFRAARYDDATAERFVRKLKEKVMAGLALQATS